MAKFIKASYSEKAKTVEFLTDSGDRLLRSGGTIAWRFNNPGNLRPGKKYTLHIGEGQTASGPFLIFPTPEAGRKEKKGLLLRKYGAHTISDMLYVYAPPHENDTEGYIQYVCERTGFKRTQTIERLSDEDLAKLMAAMEDREGYHHKKETRKEVWVRTTSIVLSDGASPLADLPIKIVRNGVETLIRTNAFGLLAPLVHYKIGEQIEIWIEDIKNEWQKIDTLDLGDKSQVLTYVRNLLIAKGSTAPHNPIPNTTKKQRVIRYVVQPDDTLSKIANRFKTDASKIQTDNAIKNPNLIMPGRVLMIGKGRSDPTFSDSGIRLSRPSAKKENDPVMKRTMTERSKDGQGHPLALIPFVQKRAPWMEFALHEAERWAGKKEDEIGKERNYHRLVNPKNGLKSLTGSNNPWCASFVNWCLMQAGYPTSHSPASSQSFLSDKNFVRLDRPVYGSIVVWSNFLESTGKPDGTGHVGFLYGTNAVLGGNQSDAINFKGNSDSTWSHNSKGKIIQKIRGYYVPLAYLEFAHGAEELALRLTEKLPKILNKDFGFSSAGNATR